MRIVSLLPSTTEILFAIGAGDDVVGVTFECDSPPEARERRIVSTSALPEGLDAAGIDAFVVAAMRAGEDLYHLDEGALAGLDADLVVTQDLCAVCAVDVSVVDDALAHLGCTAEVLTIDPHTLEEVLDSVVTLGGATGHRAEAEALVASLHARLDAVARAGRGRAAGRTAGAAAGVDRPAVRAGSLGAGDGGARRRRARAWAGPAQKSVRVTWDDVRASRPDLVVCAPCGYDLDGSAAAARDLVASGRLPEAVPVWAVDANASYARPGPRLVDGIEALARDRRRSGAGSRLRAADQVAADPDGRQLAEWWDDLGVPSHHSAIRSPGSGGTRLRGRSRTPDRSIRPPLGARAPCVRQA